MELSEEALMHAPNPNVVINEDALA